MYLFTSSAMSKLSSSLDSLTLEKQLVSEKERLHSNLSTETAVVVEYTDCICGNDYLEYDIKLHLMARPQPWRFGKCVYKS